LVAGARAAGAGNSLTARGNNLLADSKALDVADVVGLRSVKIPGIKVKFCHATAAIAVSVVAYTSIPSRWDSCRPAFTSTESRRLGTIVRCTRPVVNRHVNTMATSIDKREQMAGASETCSGDQKNKGFLERDHSEDEVIAKMK